MTPRGADPPGTGRRVAPDTTSTAASRVGPAPGAPWLGPPLGASPKPGTWEPFARRSCAHQHGLHWIPHACARPLPRGSGGASRVGESLCRLKSALVKQGVSHSPCKPQSLCIVPLLKMHQLRGHWAGWRPAPARREGSAPRCVQVTGGAAGGLARRGLCHLLAPPDPVSLHHVVPAPPGVPLPQAEREGGGDRTNQPTCDGGNRIPLFRAPPPSSRPIVCGEHLRGRGLLPSDHPGALVSPARLRLPNVQMRCREARERQQGRRGSGWHGRGGRREGGGGLQLQENRDGELEAGGRARKPCHRPRTVGRSPTLAGPQFPHL